MTSVYCTATLSTYGPKSYGWGHTVDGKPPDGKVSVAESFTILDDLLVAVVKANPNIVTGQKLRITIEPVTGS